jgi:branched-subunit amino acid aminotransferase/4-amino-4-deoxychorismate lyase
MVKLVSDMCWAPGRGYFELGEMQVHPRDLGLRRGYGLFDFLRTYHGIPFLMDYHVDKFLNSAHSELLIDLSTNREELCCVIENLAAHAQENDIGITLLATAGSSPDGFAELGEPHLMVYTSQLPPTKIAPAKTISIDYERPLPKTKSLFYLPALLARKKVQDPSVSEVLYRNRAGELTEASRSNLFGVRGNTLITPAEGILLGATRKVVLELSEELGLDVEYRGVQEAEIEALDGLFITSTLREITPVSHIDGRSIRTCSLVEELKKAFTKVVETTCFSERKA